VSLLIIGIACWFFGFVTGMAIEYAVHKRGGRDARRGL